MRQGVWCLGAAGLVAAAAVCGCRSYTPAPIDWAAEMRAVPTNTVRLATAEDAVRVALVGNPEINAQRLARANAARVAQETGWWEDPAFDIDLARVLQSSAHPFLMGSTLAFTLPLSGVPACEARAAACYTAAAAAELRAREWELAWDVRVALVRLRALRERIRLLEDYARDPHIRRARQLADDLCAAGEIAPGDVASVKRRHHARLHQLHEAERARVDEEAAFIRLLGLMPGTPVILPEGDLHQRHETPPAPGARDLVRHVRVQAACARHDVTEAELETEIRRQYPDLKVGPAYSREEGQDRLGLVAGINLPLWNRNRQAIATAEGARAIARQEALECWRDLVRAAEKTRRDLATLLEHVPAPGASREMLDHLVASGEMNVIDYLAVCDERTDLDLEEAEWRRDVCLACEEAARLGVPPEGGETR